MRELHLSDVRPSFVALIHLVTVPIQCRAPLVRHRGHCREGSEVKKRARQQWGGRKSAKPDCGHPQKECLRANGQMI